MLPNFGWSTSGAEHNDPDTLNNMLFGHIEQTPTFNDMFPDPIDETLSYGRIGISRVEDNPTTNDSSTQFSFPDTNSIHQDLYHDNTRDAFSFPMRQSILKNDSIMIPNTQPSISLPGFNHPEMDIMPNISTEVEKVPSMSMNMEPLPVVLNTPAATNSSGSFANIPSFPSMVHTTTKPGTKKKVHNTSEKRRVERLNAKIEELYSILTSTGPLINKSKINILLESIKFIHHLQSQISDLKQQMKIAEEKAKKRLGQVNEVVASQKINYHVLFLQSPVPMAVLSTDGQFIDANSQFCCLTKCTLDNLKTMTLFRFTHPEDLPCAFGSYSYMLHSKLNNPSQCIIRHCVIGGEVQPVYFSLTLIRDSQHKPSGFTCTILPVLSCDCTGNCNGSRKCSGQLRSKQGNYYLICNPPETIPCCSKLIGAMDEVEMAEERKCPNGC